MAAIKKGRGRPRFRVTPELASEIERLAGQGLTWEQIANRTHTPIQTLKKHCKNHFEIGRAEAFDQVTQTLFQMATSGDNPAATFFYLKTQCRWRETNHVEIKDATDKPVRDCSDAELQKIAKDEPEK